MSLYLKLSITLFLASGNSFGCYALPSFTKTPKEKPNYLNGDTTIKKHILNDSSIVDYFKLPTISNPESMCGALLHTHHSKDSTWGFCFKETYDSNVNDR